MVPRPSFFSRKTIPENGCSFYFFPETDEAVLQNPENIENRSNRPVNTLKFMIRRGQSPGGAVSAWILHPGSLTTAQ